MARSKRKEKAANEAQAAAAETVKVKLLRPGAQAPRYATPGAAGVDLHASVGEPIFLRPGRARLVPTGIAIELSPGWEAQVRPRSGLAAKYAVAAIFGTVDSDYRGEVQVNLHNFGADDYKVMPGDRVAQMVFARAPQLVIKVVDELSETTRGGAGFGSTGR